MSEQEFLCAGAKLQQGWGQRDTTAASPSTQRAKQHDSLSLSLTLCILGALAWVVCVDGSDVNLGRHLARQVSAQVSSSLGGKITKRTGDNSHM